MVISTSILVCIVVFFMVISIVNKYFCEFTWKKIQESANPIAVVPCLITILPLVIAMFFLKFRPTAKDGSRVGVMNTIAWCLILGAIASCVWMVNFNIAEMLVDKCGDAKELNMACDSVSTKLTNSIIFQLSFYVAVLVIMERIIQNT